MKLRIFSDVHLEYGNFPRGHGQGDEDIVIAAGDIGPGLAGAVWLKRTFSVPVIYVIGNHETYNRVLEHFEDELERQCVGTNVQFCRHPGRRVDIGDVRILGTTLWTDFAVDGDSRFAMRQAKRGMTDYTRIRRHSDARRFSGVRITPEDLLQRHREALGWLELELEKPWPGKTVLVTHHSPTPATLEFPGEMLNPCYASDLEGLLDGRDPERPAVDLAIHGHVHVRADLLVRRTRVIVNARGYARHGHLVRNFDPQLVVEI